MIADETCARISDKRSALEGTPDAHVLMQDHS